MAPGRTGKLISGITGSPEGKGYRVTSRVNKEFPYNEWINMGPRQITSWGKSYPQTNFTGVPGFFTLARNQTAQKFKNLNISLVKRYRVVA